MKKKEWYYNKKDLGTNDIFNFCFLGLFIFALIISVRHIENTGDWKGYFLAIYSVLMLFIQNHFNWKMINAYQKDCKKFK